MMKNVLIQRLLMVLTVLVLGYLYLYPGMNPIFNGDINSVMSDDTDPAALTYQYDQILKVWKENPSHFFYGAIYSDSLDPNQGFAYWMAWCERSLLVLLSYLLPLEQISTGLVFCLMLLNALSMFALSRYLGWRKSVSFGLGIAWAFCAFTRARAKVHMSMAGTYHIPLVFLGLYLVTRGKSWRSLVLAALCFLASVTTVHYFIVTTAFLTPFLILFLVLQPEFKSEWKRILPRLLGAAVPAIAFLLFNFLNPIPSGTKMGSQAAIPETGKMPDGRAHPFLYTYAAHPIDYLAGDLSLEFKPTDLNPLRGMINEHIQTTITEGNFHERTNGVRWSILVLSFFALGLLIFKKKTREQMEAREIWFFAIFGFFCFWLSLNPDTPFEGWGPSGWLYSMVSQIRVTNRAGVFAHFSLLMMTGFFLASRTHYKWKDWLLKPLVFPALMILDYPPLVQNMPMAKIAPVYSHLKESNQICGTGMYFPYISAWTDVAFYHFLQRLRGTDCASLNATSSPAQIQWMSNRFPPSAQFVNSLEQSPHVQNALQRMAECVPLHWIVFDPSVPESFRASTCSKLGWTMYPDLTCVDPKPHRAFEKWPDKCIN
jgi:hypothetical protein